MAESTFLHTQKSVLVVEDNAYLRHLLKTSLINAGYLVFTSPDGQSVPEQIQNQPIDLILLDLMLPQIDGKDLVRYIRDSSSIPIVVISAYTDPDCLVECLSLGADEFIAKPFSFTILLARLEALLRRTAWVENRTTVDLPQHMPIELDDNSSEVIIEGRRERLTPQEYRFLQYFVHHPNAVVSAETLMQEVWDTDCLSNTLISSMVRRLRSKIEAKPSEPKFLQTVWGRGYRLCTSHI